MRDRRGHQVNEFMIIVMIFLILGAVLINAILKRRAARPADTGMACVRNLLRIQDGADPKSLKCPKSDKPYRVSKGEWGFPSRTIACPEPGKHLRAGPRLLRRGKRWRLAADRPSGKAPVPGVLEVPALTREASLVLGKDALTLRMRGKPWKRWITPIWAGAVLMLLVGGGGLLIGVLLDLAFGKPRSVGWDFGLVMIFTSGMMLFGGFAAAHQSLMGGFAYTIAEVPRGGKAIKFKRTLFGRDWGGKSAVSDVVGVFPVFSKDKYQAVIVHREGQDIKHRVLMTVKGDDVEPVSLINDFLTRNSRKKTGRGLFSR